MRNKYNVFFLSFNLINLKFYEAHSIAMIFLAINFIAENYKIEKIFKKPNSKIYIIFIL